jgi:hypothetical protein
LDACYTRLYGLTRDELRYTPYLCVEPKEGYDEDFPGGTFHVWKEKEVKQFGALGVNL